MFFDYIDYDVDYTFGYKGLRRHRTPTDLHKMNEPNLRIEKLGDHNYHHWAVEMKAYLTMKGLWEFVQPTNVEDLVDILYSGPGNAPLVGEARAEAIAAVAASIPTVNLYEKAMKDKTALAYIILRTT